LLLVALAAPIAMIAATTAPASAASAATAVVQGGGTISPGLTAVPTAQTFSFSGTAKVVGVICGTTYAAADVGISADGNDLLGNVAEGAGLLNVTIGGCTASGAYVRVGAAVVVALALPVATLGTGLCGFVPDQLTPPVTSYQVKCASAIVSTQ
jgi:hypothetical protein